MSDDIVGLAWIGGCMILVVSALLSRRLTGHAWLRMAAVWVAIFAATWLTVLLIRRLVSPINFT